MQVEGNYIFKLHVLHVHNVDAELRQVKSCACRCHDVTHSRTFVRSCFCVFVCDSLKIRVFRSNIPCAFLPRFHIILSLCIPFTNPFRFVFIPVSCLKPQIYSYVPQCIHSSLIWPFLSYVHIYIHVSK